jgi:hypothetical protein
MLQMSRECTFQSWPDAWACGKDCVAPLLTLADDTSGTGSQRSSGRDDGISSFVSRGSRTGGLPQVGSPRRSHGSG